MSRFLLQRHGTTRFLAHAQGSSKLRGMVMCILNNRLLLNFLKEKELVTNSDKGLKSLYAINVVDKSTISLWASRIAGFVKGQVELTDARRFDWPTTPVRVASTF